MHPSLLVLFLRFFAAQHSGYAKAKMTPTYEYKHTLFGRSDRASFDDANDIRVKNLKRVNLAALECRSGLRIDKVVAHYQDVCGNPSEQIIVEHGGSGVGFWQRVNVTANDMFVRLEASWCQGGKASGRLCWFRLFKKSAEIAYDKGLTVDGNKVLYYGSRKDSSTDYVN